jgi:Dolichyl-phosphate-mannose-protein mannosyltransferase
VSPLPAVPPGQIPAVPETDVERVAGRPGAGATAAVRHRRPAGRIRGLPRSLLLITGTWALLMLAATTIWPTTYGLDEPQHIDMTYAYTSGLHLYGPGERPLSAAVLAVQQSYRGYPPAGALGDSPLPDRGARPTLAELGGPDRDATLPGLLPNQMVQHPPAYYLLGAGVLRLPGVAGLPFDQQVGLLRLLGVLLMLPLPVLAWATAGRLGLSPPLALTAAAVPLGVPGLVRMGASVTNDVLLVLLTGLLTYLLARVVTRDLGLRTAAAIAVVLALDLLTKGFALVLPPVVLLAYLVAWRRHRLPARSLLAPLAVAAAGGVVGGLWWLRNLIRYDAIQPSGYGPGAEGRIYGPPRAGSIVDFAPAFADGVSRRIWGGLGFLDSPGQPLLLVYGPLAVAVIALAALLVRNRPGPSRPVVVVLVAPAVLILALTASGSLSVYETYGQLTGVQGRYVYTDVVGLGVAVAAGLGVLLRERVQRALPLAVLGAALLAQLSAFVLVANSWWAPAAPGLLPSLRFAAGGMLRVSPWPAPLTVLSFVAVLVAGAAALALTTRDLRTAADRAATEF